MHSQYSGDEKHRQTWLQQESDARPYSRANFSLSSVWVTSSHTVDNLMGLSACHHLYENTACLSVKLSFSKTFFMNFHHGVKSPGDCPAHWMKLLATIADLASPKWGAWGTGVLRKSSCIESKHDSELSVCPLKDPTADLQELDNLSLLMYELKRWQNYSSFIWVPVWLECCCLPSCRTSLNQGWTVYTKGQRIYHSLCFCYICGLAKWLQFQKAQHKPGLTNTGAGGMLYLYSKGLPWGVSSLAAATGTGCLIQVPGEQASSCTCTTSCTRTDLGTTREVLGES